ncbi:conserved protein of unknown function [Paraburkholderia kururiensis]|uniref:hypothetical protein n=1 Tax=Paraburkholderia kururiensis TaxID=984307 RepID=UPI0039A6034D
MAVSSSDPLLEEAGIEVQFQLAELTEESVGDIPDVVRNVRDDACAAIGGEYRGLSSMYRGHHDVEVPAYDLCPNDGDFQEARGRLVTSISFVGPADFTDEAIAELKAFCIAKFTEAAAAHGIRCVFAGIEGWRRFSYIEQVVIEAA